MAGFSFEIRESNPKRAYELVWKRFVTLYKKRGIRKENRPQSFSYQTSWARGHISLTKGTQGTRITGTVERQMSVVFMSIFAIVVGVVIYGPIGGILFLGLTLLISLPIDEFYGSKHRSIVGSRLCKALHGTNFQQQ